MEQVSSFLSKMFFIEGKKEGGGGGEVALSYF